MRTTHYAVQIQDLLTALEDSNVVLTQLVDDIKRHDDQYLLLLHQSSRLPYRRCDGVRTSRRLAGYYHGETIHDSAVKLELSL